MHLTTFIHQKSYEHIVHKVHRHFITLVAPIIVFILLLALPLGAYWLITTMVPGVLEGAVTYPATILFGSAYYLIILVFFYSYFMDFYLDILVITNDRLIDIEQRGLFARSVSEVDLYNIQDITSEVKGIFASLFNYGKLSIQTAGAVEKFVIEDIPNPEKLRQEILDLAEIDRRYHAKQNSN